MLLRERKRPCVVTVCFDTSLLNRLTLSFELPWAKWENVLEISTSGLAI